MPPSTSRQKPLLAAFITILVWAFTFPASKAVLPYFSAEQAVLLRYLVASGFYLLLFATGRFPLPALRDWPLIFILGVLGITIYQLLFVHGVGRVSAGAAAMIITAAPVFASILARIFLAERLSRRAYAGIAASIIGIAIITFGEHLRELITTGATAITTDANANAELPGYLMLILAVLSISIYFVFQKPWFTRYSPLAMTAYTGIAGTVPLLFLLSETLTAARAAPLSALISIAVMGIFSSVIGYALWFYALSKLPAGTVTSFLFLQPVTVIIMAWLWLGEIPSTQAFIGGGITLAGVALILFPRKG